MVRYIFKRSLECLVVLFVLTFISFYLMNLMPGDPLDIACSANPDCTSETLKLMKENLGLDQPIYVRYLDWLSNALTGDLGFSRTYRLPVVEILMPRLINTLILSLVSLVISLLISIPLGILTSRYQNSKIDYTVNFLAFCGISTPVFWLGIMLILLFSVKLSWFPASGTMSIGYEDLSFTEQIMDRLQYLVLPAITLSLFTIAGWTRFTRSSMIEVMRMDYIRTARAKGISSFRVLIRHGLRNALIPIVTVVGVNIGFLFAGATITETVFAYQGAGYLLFQSINGNDFNVAMCAFTITCFMVLFMNLLVDICYAFLDPRINYK